MPFPPDSLRAHPAKLVWWVRVWMVLLAVVTLVVAVYLLVITNSLADINGNLGTAVRAVQGTGENVASLPTQLGRLNEGLEGIDGATAPLRRKADEVAAYLGSIERSLTSTDRSLKGAASALSGGLASLTGLSNVLVDMDNPPDGLGIQQAHQRLAALNGVGSQPQGSAAMGGTSGAFGLSAGGLAAAQADAHDIAFALTSIGRHLWAVCNSPAMDILGVHRC